MDALICEYCKCEDVSTAVDGMCLQCEEYLCHACFNQHLRGKKNRDHELIDVIDDEIKARKSAEEVERCKQHSGQIIEFYCRKHGYVGCERCLLPDHCHCKQEKISAVSRNFAESGDFVDIKNKLEHFEFDNEKFCQSLQMNKNEFKDIQDKLLNDIREFRKVINAYLDEAESVIMTEVKQLLSFNNDLLGKLEIDYKSLTSKLKKLKEKLDMAIYKEESLFIQTLHSKSVLKELEQQMSKCNHSISKLKHYNYEFIPDERLNEFLSLRGKLGDIKASLMKNRPPQIVHVGQPQTGPEGIVSAGHVAAAVGVSSIVGARVQRSPSRLRLFGKPGTVVDVNQDGTVKVKWDKTGKESKSLKIGKGRDQVQLI